MNKTTIKALVDDVMEGLRVLQRNGVRGVDGEIVSDAVLLDRARNIVSGLIGNFKIETWTDVELDHVYAANASRALVTA
jgi:hypothetical protein